MKNKSKRTLTPKLRFPEFRKAPGWEKKTLRVIAKPVTEKAEAESDYNVLTLSAEHGIVLQSDYFGKKVAGNDPERYIKISLDDFVYNDRTTTRSTYGTIRRLTQYDGGIVSPIYKCFRFNERESPEFWQWYFESGKHDAELAGLVNEGARAGRFNISPDKFLSTAAWCGSPAEQQKIAECLSSLDGLIAAEGRKLAALRDHKRGLMQQLFPQPGQTQPRLRFPEFQDKGDWSQGRCRDVARVLPGYGFPEKFQGNTNGQYPFYKVSDISQAVVKGERCISGANNYIGDDVLKTIRGKLVPPGTIIFAKIGEAIRSDRRVVTTKPAVIDNNTAGVKALKGKISDEFLFYLWSNVSLIDHAGGVVPAVSKSALENIPLCYPTEPDEQGRIAACLTSLDVGITAQAGKIETLKQHKRGLMQQLFPAPEEQ